MSNTQTIKIDIDSFLYTFKESSLSDFIQHADNLAPSLVEYNLVSLFEDNLFTTPETNISFNQVKNIYPFDSIQIIVDYNDDLYLKKILREDEYVYSLF